MHGIFGERERANCGRVSTPTCAASLVPAASQSHEAPPSSGFSAFKAHFPDKRAYPVGGSRPTGPVLELL